MVRRLLNLQISSDLKGIEMGYPAPFNKARDKEEKFYFSKKQEGIRAVPSKLGIWFLMISFGASFGYTVMARISLLIGRIQFLVNDVFGALK